MASECRAKHSSLPHIIAAELVEILSDKSSLNIGSASKSSIRRFVTTEKAPTRAFSWLKAATTAFMFHI